MTSPMKKEATTSAPVHDLVARRWSPRAFTGEPLPAASLRSILEAGRWAPSCFNEQPWRFILTRRDEGTPFEDALGYLETSNRVWAEKASVLLYSLAKKTFTRNAKPNRHAWHDLGLAVENMVIQALALDWHVHQMAGIDREAVARAYDIPDDYDVVTGIAIGKLAAADMLPEKLRHREGALRERKSLGDIVFVGRFGDSIAQ